MNKQKQIGKVNGKNPESKPVILKSAFSNYRFRNKNNSCNCDIRNFTSGCNEYSNRDCRYNMRTFKKFEYPSNAACSRKLWISNALKGYYPGTKKSKQSSVSNQLGPIRKWVPKSN